MKLAKFKKLHEDCHGPGYGGYVEYHMSAKKMIPPLIKVASAAFRMMNEGQNYHFDSEPYQAILKEMHDALREVEEV
jgi:hypothetical protein